MSWSKDYQYNWLEKLAMNVMKQGPIPNHVGFIMDGNRRFAKEKKVEKIKGHEQGSTTLKDASYWCQDVGIKQVTFYMFSIENFKRPPDEVKCIIGLLEKKLLEVLDEEELKHIHNRGICIQVIGDITLFPLYIQHLMAKVILATQHNNKMILNIACGYTSRYELTNALNIIRQGVLDQEIKEDDLSEKLIDQCLYDKRSNDVDLIVRTSGESRLSDFLLWQSSSAILCFVKTLWPQMSLWNLLSVIFYYQRKHSSVENFKNFIKDKKEKNQSSSEVKHFLVKNHEKYLANLKELRDTI